MKKFVYFPRGPQNETVSNLFGDELSRSFNVIGQIVQFSSKWPGSSSCTVIILPVLYVFLGGWGSQVW